jgi:hypothetical protein
MTDLEVVITGVAVLILSAAAGPGSAADESSRSAALASELTGLLKTAGRDVAAVADPVNPDWFAAGQWVPGVQLLVVDAKAPSHGHEPAAGGHTVP